MKKNRLFFMFAALLVAAAVMVSCQKEEALNTDLMLKSVVVESYDCNLVCIDAADPTYYGQTATISNNSGPQTRTFTYTVYNTLTEFELGWSYTATNNSSRQLRITVSGAGFATPKVYTSGAVQSAGTGSNTFAFDAAWTKCGVVNIKAEILEDAVVVSTATTTYSLVGACAGCDEASFDYETSDNLNIIFTYNHGEEVESVTISFTFPQVLNSELDVNGKYVGADGKLYVVNNPTNQTNFTWTGYVSCKADEAATFAFSVKGDCSAPPANDGQAIIWTDATVIAINGVLLVDDPETVENEGPYSLKGTLSNIVYTGCPKSE
ncbi:MAG: hypothetical protein ACOZDD_13200 [Bacteroidota bacterium]